MIWQRDHFSRCVLSDWDSGRSPFGQVVDENAVKQLVLDSPHLPSRFFVSWSPCSVNIVQCQADQEEEELQLSVFRSTETHCKQTDQEKCHQQPSVANYEPHFPIMALKAVVLRFCSSPPSTSRFFICLKHTPLQISLLTFTPALQFSSTPAPRGQLVPRCF